MERLLRYSLEHKRFIRVIYVEEDGTMRQVSVLVRALSAEEVTMDVMRPRRLLTLPLTRLLSADYRKGDEGQD